MSVKLKEHQGVAIYVSDADGRFNATLPDGTQLYKDKLEEMERAITASQRAALKRARGLAVVVLHRGKLLRGFFQGTKGTSGAPVLLLVDGKQTQELDGEVHLLRADDPRVAELEQRTEALRLAQEAMAACLHQVSEFKGSMLESRPRYGGGVEAAVERETQIMDGLKAGAPEPEREPTGEVEE